MYRAKLQCEYEHAIAALEVKLAVTACCNGDVLLAVDSEAQGVAVDPETGMPIGEWEAFFTMEGPGGADGSVVDSEGFVWNARWGAGKAIRISPDGKLDKTVEVPGGVTRVSCPAFGGKDYKTLFLTTAREGFTPQEEIDQPTAGGVFAIELDVPGLIHSAGSCSARESYTLKFINEESIAIISLLGARTFDTFPGLKIVVAHAGGAIPYQMGRFRSWSVRKGDKETFDEQLRKLYFDTCNYSKESIELLCRIAGTDNVLFGTEKPGTGSSRDPVSGRDYDDMKPVIESIDWLTDAQKRDIFECNCKRVYNRAFRKDEAC